MKFKIGDIVQHKTGGPSMVVMEADPDHCDNRENDRWSYNCTFFYDPDKKANKTSFAAGLLFTSASVEENEIFHEARFREEELRAYKGK